MNDNAKIILSAYSGAGVGLLLGVIMGTSITPTVATVFAALTAMLAAMLGVNDGHFSSAKAARLGSFGFACVLGAYLGLFIRSHNLLAPSLISLKEEYLAIGFTEEKALELILNKIQPGSIGALADVSTEIKKGKRGLEDMSIASASYPNDQSYLQHSSVLFSAKMEMGSCQELADTDYSLTLEQVVNNFEITAGGWGTLAGFIVDEVEESRRKVLLLSVRDAVCIVDGAMDVGSCEIFTTDSIEGNYNQWSLSGDGHHSGWHAAVRSLEDSTLHEEERPLAIRLVKEMLCGD